MSKERDYRWYVEPLDAHTNEVVGRDLTDDNMVTGFMCADGKRRNMWRVDRDLLAKLKRSRRSLRLKFNIFSQEGNGPIKPSAID